MNLVTMYEKGADAPGWFGPTLGRADDEDGLKQILTYNQAQERGAYGQIQGFAAGMVFRIHNGIPKTA